MSSATIELRAIADRIAAALPPVAEEAVLTGSVSRGVADVISDIEMLVVTRTPLDLAECFEHAGRLGFVDIDTWGAAGDGGLARVRLLRRRPGRNHLVAARLRRIVGLRGPPRRALDHC